MATNHTIGSTVLHLRNLRDGTTIDLRFRSGIYTQVIRWAGQVTPVITRISDGKRAAKIIADMYDMAARPEWSLSNDRISVSA